MKKLKCDKIIGLRVPEELIERIDHYSSLKEINRSEFIRETLDNTIKLLDNQIKKVDSLLSKL